MANLREEEKQYVARMNAKIVEYFDYLGVSEATNIEFLSKADAMLRSGAFTSEWFHDMTFRPYHLLGQDEPPVVIDYAVEDEGSSSNDRHF